MIRGRITPQRQVVIPLQVGDGRGTFQTIEVIVDTGYNGSLVLSSQIITELSLAPLTRIGVTLGDNVRRRLNSWRGYLMWHDRLRTIPVLEASGPPLLGTRLLAGSQLTAQFRNGGEVLIEEL